jgi:hypothetical protein
LVWSKSVNTDSYDAAFAAAFLAEAQNKAAKVLEDAETSASQISSPPNCTIGSSRAGVSIGGDPSTGVIALIYENPGICDLVVRASAEFYCPRGRSGNNTVISRATFALKARAKIYVSLSPERYFPLVVVECRQLTGYTSNTISVANELTRRSNPTVNVESSRYPGVFNQAEATKKANQILNSAQSRAKQIIADAKNPALIKRAWDGRLKKAAAEATEKAAAEATEKAAAEKAAAEAAVKEEANRIAEERERLGSRAAVDAASGTVCNPSSNCPLGSMGPGGGIVIYDAGSQQSWGRYLEVAPAGWSGELNDPIGQWCDVTNVNFSSQIIDPALKATLGVEIGKGKANTNLSLVRCAVGAGVRANAYKGGGKSDWYLPSKDELNQVCKYAQYDNLNSAFGCSNLKTLRPGFMINHFYWSSTEDIRGVNSIVWRQNFYEGLKDSNGYKYQVGYIRPIRSISTFDNAFDKAAADAKAAAAIVECSESGRNCEVGNKGPGGGIVFYDAGSQQSWGRYLEFAPIGWSGAVQDPVTQWCEKTSNLVGAWGIEIGTGKSNTDLMLAACTSGAAVEARAYKGGGKSDWHLPSIYEFNELCKFARYQATGNPKIGCERRGQTGHRGGFEERNYWTSSESNASDASLTWVGVGGGGSPNKVHPWSVRPVRAF